MKNYEKPIVLANSELSEGVFTASGTFGGGTASGNDALSVIASIAGSNGSNTCYFSGKVTNNTAESITGWSVQLAFSGAITKATIYNCNVSINGNILTITPACDWNQTIAAGGSADISGEVIGATVLYLA